MNRPAEMASWLTAHSDKRRLYPDDVFFREALADYRRLSPGAARGMADVAFLLLKPEAIVRRSGERILSFLRTHGYSVPGARMLHVGRHASRDLWRYQFNAAPLSVMRAVDILFDAAPAVCLAVAGDSGPADGPAATRLAAHKGSHIHGIPAESLRGLLGSPTLVLNFVHAPDDPADVLRELGVLLDPPGRREFLAVLLGCRSAERHETAEAVLQAAYDRHPAGDLDLAASLARVERAATGPGERAIVADIGTMLRRPRGDEELMIPLDWLAAAPASATAWDRAVVAAFLVGHQRLVGPPLVETPPAETPPAETPPAPRAATETATQAARPD